MVLIATLIEFITGFGGVGPSPWRLIPNSEPQYTYATCILTAESAIRTIYYNGEDVTHTVSPKRVMVESESRTISALEASWVPKTLQFRVVPGAVLSIAAEHQDSTPSNHGGDEHCAILFEKIFRFADVVHII